MMEQRPVDVRENVQRVHIVDGSCLAARATLQKLTDDGWVDIRLLEIREVENGKIVYVISDNEHYE